MEISYQEVFLRLFLSVLLGGGVGFERERYNRPAGFRTHVLVCLGSTLVMLVSAYGFSSSSFSWSGGVDPSRMAAQVVTGVGFLGAGTILRHGTTVTGLTTAASLWVVSGIGLALGIGFYLGAVLTTVLVLLSLVIFIQLERNMVCFSRYKRLWLRGVDKPGLLGRVGELMGRLNVNINKVNMSESTFDENLKRETVVIELMLRIPKGLKAELLLQKISQLAGVLEVGWVEPASLCDYQ